MAALYTSQRAPGALYGPMGADAADVNVTAAISGTVTGTVAAAVDVSDPVDVSVSAAIVGSITGTLDAAVTAASGSSASAAEIWNYILPNGLTAGQVFCDLHKIHGLTPGIPLAVTSAARTAGDISQTITDSAGVVTVTRQ